MPVHLFILIGKRSRLPRLGVWRQLSRGARLLASVSMAACTDAATPPTAPQTPGSVAPTPSVANVAPTAQFAVSPRWPAPGDTVTFDARYSHDNDGQVAQYRWTASNGVTMTSGAVTRVVFRTAGTYAITLTALDNSGDSSSTTLSLPVSSAGAPPAAVSASESRLSLAATTVGGGASVTATITAKNAAGATISGATVGVSATGLRVRASPITGAANASGVFTSSLSSGVAQTVVVRGVADFTALTDTATLSVTAAVAASVSAVRLTESSLTSITDSSFLEVTARDTAGNPVPGIAVTVSGSPGGLVVSNEGTTDANGRRVMTLKSTVECLPITLTVNAGGVTLSAAPVLLSGGLRAYTICGPTTWLDASDLSSFTTEGSSSRITEWRDRSGYARHARATTGTTMRPTLSSTALNGLPAVVFAGGDNTTATPEHLALTSYPAGSNSTVTYFVVFNMAVSNRCARVFDFGSSSSTSYVLYAPDCSGHRYAGSLTGASAEISAAGTSGLAVNTSGVAMIQHSTSALLRFNGAQVGTVGSIFSPNALGTPTRHWFGRSQFGQDGYFGGQIAEFLSFPRLLSNIEYAAVEQALMRKWGLGTIVITQGNTQTATASTSPTSGLGFRVVDAQGNAISGATLTLQVTAGGGRLSGGTTLTVSTDGNGNAYIAPGVWVLDYGTNVITAWLSATAGQGKSITLTGTGTLPSNLVMQYDASQTTTLFRSSSCTGSLAAVGDSVGCWMDLTSNVRHVTQATAAARPIVSTFGTSGRQALRFVKTRENYLASTASGLGTLANGPRTIVSVATANTTEDNSINNAATVVSFPAGYISGVGFFGYPTVSVAGARQYTSAGAQANAFLSYTPNTAVVLSQVVAVTGQTFSTTVGINGVTNTGSANGTPSGSPDLMRFGQAFVSPDTDYRWRLDGQIAEVMVFSRALTNNERLQVERYMGWKWGITVP